MEKEIFTAIFLGIGLSASVGFRVFVPMLIAAIAARTGFLPVSESFEWLASGTSIACFGAATIVEIVAYYVPFFDNLLDTFSSPLAIGAGTLLTATVLPVDDQLLKWVMALIIGGGSASIVQGATSVSRLSSSAFTGGLGNPVIASGENIASIATPVFAIVWPLLIGTIIVLVLMFFVNRLIRRKRRKRLKR